MKNNFLLLFAISLISCSNSTNVIKNPSDSLSTINPQTINDKDLSITFKDSIGNAVLIGDKINLLDNNLNVIEDITGYSGKIINVKGVSDSLFNQKDEICNSFWYVRIKSNNKEGIVNGRQVFMIEDESLQDTSILINGKKFDIYTTNFLGMGVVYQGDLMACPVDKPILIKDEKNGFFGLIDLIKNKYSQEAISNNDFPYFQLRNDDGCQDKIISIKFSDNIIRLKIHRMFQDGENDCDVILRFDNNKYSAEYLNYGEIKYN